MVYNELLDGAFCIASALFCQNRPNKGISVNRPFTTWHKRSEKRKEHQRAKYHQGSLQLTEEFIHTVNRPTSTVAALLNTRKPENIERNRSIVKRVLQAIIYCCRQCIALRGHQEWLNQPENTGNVLSLLKLMGTQNEVLRNHLEFPTGEIYYLRLTTDAEQTSRSGSKAHLAGERCSRC